jgi:TamB, inner membrane protein subunit of TAM complex
MSLKIYIGFLLTLFLTPLHIACSWESSPKQYVNSRVLTSSTITEKPFIVPRAFYRSPIKTQISPISTNNQQGGNKRLKKVKGFSNSSQLSLWQRWSKKKKQYSLYVRFDKYRFKFGKWLAIAGTVTGSMTLEMKSLRFKTPAQFLKKMINGKGDLQFSTLEIPFYGKINNIKIRLSPFGKFSTKFSGSVGDTLRLGGEISNGIVKTRAAFQGLDITRHLPFPLNHLFQIKTNGVINFTLAERSSYATIVLKGVLALMNKKGKHGEYLIIRNSGNIILHYKNRKFVIKKGTFDIGGYEIGITGYATRKYISVKFLSQTDISIFSPWIPGPISRTRGAAILTGKLEGPIVFPILTSRFSMVKGSLNSDEGKKLFDICNLLIVLTENGVSISSGFSSGSKRKLILKGKINIKDYVPKTLTASLKGSLPGELLKQLGQFHFSLAKGWGDLDLKLSGDYESPELSGTFQIRDLTLKPRGFSKQFRFTKGIISIRNKQLYMSNITSSYDGGKFYIKGHLKLSNNFPMNLTVNGINLPWKKTNVFSGEFNPHVRIFGTLNKLTIAGKVDIVRGKYTRGFDILKKIIAIKRFNETKDKIWNHYPWIGKIKLDLSLLNTGDLEVDNNIAQLSLDGLLAIKGSIAKPKLKGMVNVNFGTFKIPFLKGLYEVDRGTIDFDKTKEPFLSLLGTTSVENYLGEEILIKLKLLGPINKLTFALTSFPELEQGEILMLLASGRTTSELRQQYHGNPRSGTGTGTTNYNPVEMYDEPIKQITGDFLSTLVAAPIKMVTKLDLIRFELGSDSFQLRISKKFIKRIKLKGEVEIGFFGQNRQELGVEMKFHDRLRLDSKIRRYEPGINEYLYETPLTGKVELKYKIKLRGSFRDILGI